MFTVKLVLAVALSLNGVAPALQTIVDPAIKGKTWHLVSMHGKAFVVGSPQGFTLEFIGDPKPAPPTPIPYNVQGVMACNALSANYNIELASTLKFTEFSQTLIECGNLLDRSRETAYNAAMREVTSYHIESSNAYTALIMFNAEGAEVLRYSDTYTVRKTYFPFINKSR